MFADLFVTLRRDDFRNDISMEGQACARLFESSTLKGLSFFFWRFAEELCHSACPMGSGSMSVLPPEAPDFYRPSIDNNHLTENNNSTLFSKKDKCVRVNRLLSI